MSRGRIAVITGTRAEYGLLQSTLEALRADRRVEVQLIVAGIHLLRRFGHTVDQISADGWPIAARVLMQRGDDAPTDQADGLARGVRGIAAALARLKSDMALVLGDRIEAMAGALAATTIGCTLAHIHGGDVAPGDFDQKLRDAITQMADLHFTATAASTERVLQLGARASAVHRVGAPGLDRLRKLMRTSKTSAARTSALIVQHAYGRPAATERKAMACILDQVAGAGFRRVVIFPNSDRGNRGIFDAIRSHLRASNKGDCIVHESLARDDYLRLLLQARFLIGNSSSGIIEAPLAGTPSIDVGDRQRGREPGGSSVIRAKESPQQIARAIRRAARLQTCTGAETVYGDGRAGNRIARVLVASI